MVFHCFLARDPTELEVAISLKFHHGGWWLSVPGFVMQVHQVDPKIQAQCCHILSHTGTHFSAVFRNFLTVDGLHFRCRIRKTGIPCTCLLFSPVIFVLFCFVFFVCQCCQILPFVHILDSPSGPIHGTPCFCLRCSSSLSCGVSPLQETFANQHNNARMATITLHQTARNSWEKSNAHTPPKECKPGRYLLDPWDQQH